MATYTPPNPELSPEVQALLDDEQRRAAQAHRAASQAKESSRHAWMLGAWRGRSQTALERTTQSTGHSAKPALLGGPPPKIPERGR